MVTSIKGNDTSTFGGNVDVTGNVITDAPAFRAQSSATQSISNGTATKVIFDTEIFDSNSCYDPTTNYRFTPTVAGYYQVNIVLDMRGTSKTYKLIDLYKNGSRDAILLQNRLATSSNEVFNGSCLVYCNGTTDYLEVYGTIDATSPSFGIFSMFSASLVRAV